MSLSFRHPGACNSAICSNGFVRDRTSGDRWFPDFWIAAFRQIRSSTIFHRCWRTAPLSGRSSGKRTLDTGYSSRLFQRPPLSAEGRDKVTADLNSRALDICQDHERDFADVNQSLSFAALHVLKHGASNVGNIRKVIGEFRNVVR